MAMTRIEIEIDEIVLHGLGEADRDHIAALLRDELARVLTEPRTHARTGREEPRTRPAPRIAAGAMPVQVSAQLTRAIATEIANHAGVRRAMSGSTRSPGREGRDAARPRA